ncbi:MAG: tyrosine--tRNA ligase [Christensenellales bacterium]|jgi:tyrosyl-tRNA synthetase
MSQNVYDVLKERGYIQQTTHEDELREMMGKQSITFYVGFDPTADSLHIGHYLPMMVMTHLQRAGHRPIALVGGGTVMVGDPSGRTDMRQMLTREQIDRNVAGIAKQLGRLLDFEGENACIMENNASWLTQLNYIEFLRDVGVHFSVNRMLTAECYKNRMEKGLSFLEFNYMLMQAYDFLVLNQKYGCVMELGGDDQWSNILAGADLIRRKEQKPAFGLTLQLLTTSEGVKMGKTVKGALWLDETRTSPYEFYQYWRNVADADVERCLALLTFLPMDEVRRLGRLPGEEINQAKRTLAYEVTKLIHGQQAADQAQAMAESLFGSAGGNNAPVTSVTADMLADGSRVIDALVWCKLAKSRGEGRRLIAGGGVYLEEEKVTDPDMAIPAELLDKGDFLLRKGKKAFARVQIAR